MGFSSVQRWRNSENAQNVKFACKQIPWSERACLQGHFWSNDSSRYAARPWFFFICPAHLYVAIKVWLTETLRVHGKTQKYDIHRKALNRCSRRRHGNLQKNKRSSVQHGLEGNSGSALHRQAFASGRFKVRSSSLYRFSRNRWRTQSLHLRWRSRKILHSKSSNFDRFL